MATIFEASAYEGKALHFELFADDNIRVSEVIIAEGTDYANHHSHYRGEVFVLLGNVKFTVANGATTIEQGSSLAIPPDTPHTAHGVMNSVCLTVEFFKG